MGAFFRKIISGDKIFSKAETFAVFLLLLPVMFSCSDNKVTGSAEQEPAKISIEISNKKPIEGDSVEFLYKVMDHRNHPIDYLPPWIKPVWSVENEEILKIEGEKLIAVKVGESNLMVHAGDLESSETIRVNPGELRVDIEKAYIVQSVQNRASVPLVANRDAFLRVFAKADRLNFFEPPEIHASIYTGNTLVKEVTIRPGEFMASSPAIPEKIDEGNASLSWNIPLPGDLIQSGLRFELQFDPENNLPLLTDSQVSYSSPADPASIPVYDVPPFNVRFVPVHQPGIGTGDVNDSNVEDFLDFTRRVFPLYDIQVDVRAPYTTSTKANTQEDWSQILSELRALRLADNSSRYYHGIIKRLGGPAGIGYVGLPVALSYDHLPLASVTVAHELGHNFGLLHTDCGSPNLVDPHFPHSGGTIGYYGYDVANDEIIPPSTPDLMGYCGSGWISDYHTGKVLAFREQEQNSMMKGKTPVQESVLIWGRIGSGVIVIEPLFYITSVPSLPQESGPYTLELMDSSGSILYSASFTPEQVADGPGLEKHFAFSIPVNRLRGGRVERVRVYGEGIDALRSSELPPQLREELIASGEPFARLNVEAKKQVHDGVSIRWDASDFPMIMVREPGTGAVLSFARGGEIALQTDSDFLELNISDGISSFTRTQNIKRR